MDITLSDSVKFRAGQRHQRNLFRTIFTPENSRLDIHNPPLRSETANHRFHESSESSEEDVFVDEQYQLTEHAVSRPLMPPRQRVKVQTPKPTSKCQKLVWPVISFCVFAGLLACVVLLVIYLVDTFTNQVDDQQDGSRDNASRVLGCSHLEVEDVWVVGIPKLMTESAFRLLDVNEDGVLDVLFGFATGAEGYHVPDIVCDIYFNGTRPCLGGLLALDGRTGKQIWRHYTNHEIFAVNCNEDLNLDGMADCIVAGRVGTFEAVSGRDGQMLWNFTHPARVGPMNLYTGQFIQDLNGDGVPEVLNIHGGDPFGEPGSETRMPGRIFIFSGRTGEVIQWMGVPDEKESYYSPVLYSKADGTQGVLFGTGGETHPGSLWYITLSDLYKGNIQKAVRLYENPYKGIMTPPNLLDLTGDGVADIVFSTYNATVLALDGQTFAHLWNFTYAWSETYATPAPGFYNDDGVPDFMVHWQYGPGFPVYYHSISTVLDGRNGNPLVTPYIKSAVGAQASPLTISVEGKGNDIFLFWVAGCLGHEGKGGEYHFTKGTNVHEKSRSDFCRLRFKTKGFSRMYALNQHLKPPGYPIYDSEKRKEEEYSSWVNTTAEAQIFLRGHPNHLRDYKLWQDWVRQQKAKSQQHHEDYNLGKKQSLNLDSGDRQQIFPSNSETESDIKMSGNNDAPDLQSARLPWEYLPNTGDNMDEDYGGRDVLSGSDSDGYRGLFGSSPGDSRVHGNRDYSDDSHFWYRDRPDDYISKMANIMGTLNKNKDQDNYPKKIRARKNNVLPKRTSTKRSHILKGHFMKRDIRNSPKYTSSSQESKQRKKRHVGPHDEGGLQRLISTGTLAPPMLSPSHPDYAHSMDVIFATYWFYPAETEAILPEDKKCIELRMKDQATRFDPNSKYYGMDEDGYAHALKHECLEKSEHQLPKNGVYESQHSYNPYKVHMGQLTVYRLRLKCTCGREQRQHRCSRILPFDKQQWAAYMGSSANSHWLSRQPL